MTAAVPICTLEPGQRFRLACLPKKPGTLIRVGESGAKVQYETETTTISWESPVLPVEEPTI